MTDILLDSNNDIQLHNGDIVLTPTREVLIAQKIRMKLRTFTGTLWTNINYGINTNLIFKRNTQNMVDANIIQLISDVDGVIEVVEFTSTITDRIYTCVFKAKIDTGKILEISDIKLSPTMVG